MKNNFKDSGINDSEKRLVQICKKTFLDFWYYPNVYKSSGNELCDILVVCDNNVIIFSDKNISFSIEKVTTSSYEFGMLDFNNKKRTTLKNKWRDWYNKAIKDSYRQLFEAQEWIKNNHDQIFLDNKATKKLPVVFPKNPKIHLIAVANGAQEACTKYFQSGSGSLVFKPNKNTLYPFTIHDHYPEKSFVHIFDYITLPIVLMQLNTITDFLEYLEAKEKLIRSVKNISYPGEEDLLSLYLRSYDEKTNKHCFPIKLNLNQNDHIIFYNEGAYFDFINHPSYIQKQKEDEFSYGWDKLINKFSFYNHHPYSNTTREHEGGIRYMSMETRFSRRILGWALEDFINKYPEHKNMYARTQKSPTIRNLLYVFLQFKNNVFFKNYEEYREARKAQLYAYLLVAKLKFPFSNKLVGIAFDPPKFTNLNDFSEDIMLIENWDEEIQKEAEEISKNLDIFNPDRMNPYMFSFKEYPDPIK